MFVILIRVPLILGYYNQSVLTQFHTQRMNTNLFGGGCLPSVTGGGGDLLITRFICFN